MEEAGKQGEERKTAEEMRRKETNTPFVSRGEEGGGGGERRGSKTYN